MTIITSPLLSGSAFTWTDASSLMNYLQAWPEPGMSREQACQIALDTLSYHRHSRDERRQSLSHTELESYWYSSLIQGQPDYSIYTDVRYIGELWVSWILYSRKYLLDIAKLLQSGRIVFHAISTIADLGCGLGFSTAALAELWPQATVYGTNVDGPQAVAATQLGIPVYPSISGPVDLVFASEYFEHFDRPYSHLSDILTKGRYPRYLILASTFNSPSTGHFPIYQDEHGHTIPGKLTGRGFNMRLRAAGYQQIETGFWNNRPALWERRI